MNTNRLIAALAFVTIYLAACTGNQQLASKKISSTEDLFGREWHLHMLRQLQVPASSTASLLFAAGDTPSVSGNAGCNQLHGIAQFSGDAGIQFSNIGVTRMACLDKTLALLESNFLEVLAKTNSWRISNEQLLLSSNDTVLATLSTNPVASPPTANHEINGSWELEYLDGSEGDLTRLFPQKKPVLNFKLPDTLVSGNGGCNGFSSRLKIQGNQISFGGPLSTMMACEGNGEPVFFNTLQRINSYVINNNQTLTLIRGDMALMRFKKLQ